MNAGDDHAFSKNNGGVFDLSVNFRDVTIIAPAQRTRTSPHFLKASEPTPSDGLALLSFLNDAPIGSLRTAADRAGTRIIQSPDKTEKQKFQPGDNWAKTLHSSTNSKDQFEKKLSSLKKIAFGDQINDGKKKHKSYVDMIRKPNIPKLVRRKGDIGIRLGIKKHNHFHPNLEFLMAETTLSPYLKFGAEEYDTRY